MTKPKCGCTVVDYDKTIPPGGKGKIKADLRTSEIRGDFEKTIDVTTNDPARNSFKLVLAGRVVEAVALDPDRVPAMHLSWEGPTGQQVILRPRPDVKVTGVTSAERYVQARLEPLTDGMHRLRLTVGVDAPPGRSNFVVNVATTAEHEPVVPITVECEKGIIVTPESIRIPTIRAGVKATAKTMVLVKKHQGKLQLRSAISSDPNLKVEVGMIKEGELYRLLVSYTGDPAKFDPATTVTVETDDPQQPKLTIPVRNSRPNPAKPAAPK